MAIPDPDDSTRPTPREVKAVVELLRWDDMPGLDRVTLTDDDGAKVRLRDLWAERPAALVFLRHYG